ESAIFNTGVSYLWLKNYKEAEKYFKKTIKINSSSAKAYKHLGNTYYYINDLKKAYIEWKKAYQLDPNDKELENNLKVLDSKQQGGG
ncbi:MAG: tetratricopeptide repeat protein, partial [Spirochaetes bacterium]|nr:tetratricopeptide repeat protein [Spirochaetota bacterium]